MSTATTTTTTATPAHTGTSLGSTVRFCIAIPAVYLGVLPFFALDAFLWLYQTVCFSAWKVPKVDRVSYLRFDRTKLPYLNWHQRLNCHYCSYANGLAAYFREIAARTEQYWCPIRHDADPPAPHSRYHRFIPYGDAESFRRRHESVRADFSDLE